MNNDGWGFMGAGMSDDRIEGDDLQHARQSRTADEAPHMGRIKQIREGGGPMKEHMDKHMHHEEHHGRHSGHSGHSGEHHMSHHSHHGHHGIHDHLEEEKHRHHEAMQHHHHHLSKHHGRHFNSQHGHDHYKY